MNTAIIYLTVAAVITAYAFLMSIFNKQHNRQWLVWEGHLTTLFCLLLLVICFEPLIRTYSVPFLLFGGALFIATINAIILSVAHIRNVHSATEYPETMVSTSKKFGIVTFALLVFALLSLVASFPF